MNRRAVEVRPAIASDAEEVRRVVAQALLASGFGPPDAERDADLVELAYYGAPGRGLWVAEASDGRVVGCAALDRGEGDAALLRRLAGEGLDALLEAALRFARAHGRTAVETVLPPAMREARDAAERAGFQAVSENDLLLRRVFE
jgi:GNAT superfamily N-acetyltransferase